MDINGRLNHQRRGERKGARKVNGRTSSKLRRIIFGHNYFAPRCVRYQKGRKQPCNSFAANFAPAMKKVGSNRGRGEGPWGCRTQGDPKGKTRRRKTESGSRLRISSRSRCTKEKKRAGPTFFQERPGKETLLLPATHRLEGQLKAFRKEGCH